MENLLSYYVLERIETFKLGIELHRAIPPDVPCQARIELKLTPIQSVSAAANPAQANLVFGEQVLNTTPVPQGQWLEARLNVIGHAANRVPEERFFTLDVAVRAHYQSQGSEPGFEVFHRAHTSLTRQLLPVLQQRAMRLLAEVGVFHVHLPIDLVHAEAEIKPSAYH